TTLFRSQSGSDGRHGRILPQRAEKPRSCPVFHPLFRSMPPADATYDTAKEQSHTSLRAPLYPSPPITGARHAPGFEATADGIHIASWAHHGCVDKKSVTGGRANLAGRASGRLLPAHVEPGNVCEQGSDAERSPVRP